MLTGSRQKCNTIDSQSVGRDEAIEREYVLGAGLLRIESKTTKRELSAGNKRNYV